MIISWRCGADEVASWETIEEFVEFWSAMSEQKIAAFMAGLNTTADKVTYVTGTVTRAQLEQVSMCPEDGQGVEPDPAMAPVPVADALPVYPRTRRDPLVVAARAPWHPEREVPILPAMPAEPPPLGRSDSDVARELQAHFNAIAARPLGLLRTDSEVARDMQAEEWRAVGECA